MWRVTRGAGGGRVAPCVYLIYSCVGVFVVVLVTACLLCEKGRLFSRYGKTTLAFDIGLLVAGLQKVLAEACATTILLTVSARTRTTDTTVRCPPSGLRKNNPRRLGPHISVEEWHNGLDTINITIHTITHTRRALDERTPVLVPPTKPMLCKKTHRYCTHETDSTDSNFNPNPNRNRNRNPTHKEPIYRPLQIYHRDHRD